MSFDLTCLAIAYFEDHSCDIFTVASVMLYLKSTMQMDAKPESDFFSNCAQLERNAIFSFPFQTASPCGPSGTDGLMEFYLSSLQLTWLLRNECAGLLSHQTGCKVAPNWGKRA